MCSEVKNKSLTAKIPKMLSSYLTLFACLPIFFYITERTNGKKRQSKRCLLSLMIDAGYAF